MSNNFLGSTVTSSDISTETTQAKVLDKLNAGLTILPTSKIFVQTDTNDLVDVSIDASNITGTLPVSVSSVTITDVNNGGSQTTDLDVNVTNTSITVDDVDNVQNGTAIDGNTFGNVAMAENDTTNNAQPLQVTSAGLLKVTSGGTQNGTAIDGSTIGVVALAENNSTNNAQPVQVNSSGQLVVTPTPIPNPLTVFSNAEQAQGVSTYAALDNGVGMAAVRSDTLADKANANFRYTPLQVNGIGALYVEVNDIVNVAGNAINVNTGEIDTGTLRVVQAREPTYTYFNEFLKSSGDIDQAKDFSGGGAVDASYIVPTNTIVYISDLEIYIEDDEKGSPELDEYGQLAELTTGIKVWYNRGSGKVYLHNDLPIKKNSDFAVFTSNITTSEASALDGNNAIKINWNFKDTGQSIRIDSGNSFGVEFNDDLSDLVHHYFVIQGYLTGT